MTRTFLALDLDASSRRALGKVAARLDAVGARVRWTDPANLHVTMKFLGDVADEDLPGVCEAAAEIAAEVPAFEFTIDRVVSSPAHGHMRMVWVEIGDPTGRMTDLAGRLNDAYAAMGYKYENRGFKPHLTLGRVKGGRRVGPLREAIAAGPAPKLEPQYADELAVYSSRLTPDGPVYTPLSRAPLGREE